MMNSAVSAAGPVGGQQYSVTFDHSAHPRRVDSVQRRGRLLLLELVLTFDDWSRGGSSRLRERPCGEETPPTKDKASADACVTHIAHVVQLLTFVRTISRLISLMKSDKRRSRSTTGCCQSSRRPTARVLAEEQVRWQNCRLNFSSQ